MGQTGTSFTSGTPTALFSATLKGSTASTFDVSPDGQRFLVNAQPETSTSNLGATLMLNWPEILQR